MQLSKEIVKNAPIVDAKTENVSEIEEKPQVDPKTELLNALSPPPFPVDIESIDKKSLEMAESFGVPVKGILEWVKSNQAWQANIAVCIANLGEANGKVLNFLGNVEKAQAEQQKIAAERKRTELEFLAAHPEVQQRATPAGGSLDMGALGQILPQIAQSFLAPAPPVSPYATKANELMEKIFEKAIKDITDPTPSPLEEIGAKFLTDYASKAASIMASKVVP